LLEKDPVKRITASEALKHDFFSNDSIYSEITRAKSFFRQEMSAGKDE
jgi:serine/threonine protein kinase